MKKKTLIRAILLLWILSFYGCKKNINTAGEGQETESPTLSEVNQ